MKKKLLIILQIVLFSCLAMESQASVYYVKTTGSNSNNGTTWALAKADVQAAINASSAGDEIWIAAGTYKPTLDPSTSTASGNTRDYAFYLLGKNIGIYGGFAGTETARSQRNIATNPVILSGDIGTANDSTDNCYHVFVTSVYLSSAAILDGFSVQNGNANGSGSLRIPASGGELFYRYMGGGINNGLFTRPTLSNLTISSNDATQGGGIYIQNNNSGAPTLTNVTISGNTATSLGGGLYNYKAPPTITNVTISGNTGRGMYNIQASPTLNNVIISGNSDGGMYNSQSSPALTNVTISSNTSTNGGGIFNDNYSSPTLTNVTISANTASVRGGGMLNNSFCSPTITNTTFSENTTTSDGGGMYNHWSSNPTITNSTFSNNTAATEGGGMHNYSSSPTIVNSIFCGNIQGSSSTATGSDIYNSTLYSTSSTPTITYTTLQVSYTGTGNSTSDPLFVDASTPAGADGIHRTADDGLRLFSHSPAANSGSNSAIPTGITTDIIGSARTQNTTVNMGAYEDLQYILYVDSSASGSNTGASWTNAYTSLESAIAAATSGDYIWVAAGTYYPSAYPAGASGSSDRDYSFFLAGGVHMYGGFAGTETALAARDYATNVTILSGDIGTANTTSDNCHHVVISANETTTSTLDGFTVTRGNANGSGYFMVNGNQIYRSLGGGMLNRNASPTISNCTFSYNTGYNGGGMNNYYASPTITNCTFTYNTGTNTAGGMMNNAYCSPTITNSTFSNNTSNQIGGMYMYNNCSPVITNTTFSENSGTYQIGGMAVYSACSPIVTNCIFWGNKSAGSTTVKNSDIQNAPGGGASVITITYTTLQLASSSYTSTNNNLFTGGTGNLYVQDPLFVDASSPAGADGIYHTADDGLRLYSNSPAANTGNNDSIPSGITTDIIGSARTQNTTVNMGAYEDLTTVCSSTSALPTTAGTTYTADYKNTDANGWTNYCSVDEKLLLSLKIGSSGAVVAASEVELKLGSSTTYSYVGNDGGMISTRDKGYVMIDRRWDVSPTTQPSSDVGVKYYFTSSEYTDLASALSTHNSSATGYPSTLSAVGYVDLYKSTSGSAFADPHTVSGIIIDNGSTLSDTVWVHSTHGTADHSAEFEVSSFSGGGAGGGGGGGASAAGLPVELIHFTSQAMAHTTAELNWATATEIDNSHFVIERSYDGLTFEAIDRVEGNGNSDAVLHYAYTDTHIAQGSDVVYYRLHQFDYNGTSEYSVVRKVSFEMNNLAKPSIAIYPNPFTSDVYINFSTLSGAEATIKVTNLSGQQLLERSIDNTQSIENVDLSSLKKGVYFINITSDSKSSMIKVIKR
ncbi:MAG: hypothetical protein ACI9WM_000685 [Arenicella sp.]|jgi:hypothetical protein